MKTNFTILITDRNPHVRCFLKRELAAEGFRILVAESGREILESSFGPIPIDLIVMDPDLPDMDSKVLLQKLNGRIPPLPVILHTLPGEEENSDDPGGMIVQVEKGEHSIDSLKGVISERLLKNQILMRKDAALKMDR